jgi:hypothetical protein
LFLAVPTLVFPSLTVSLGSVLSYIFLVTLKLAQIVLRWAFASDMALLATFVALLVSFVVVFLTLALLFVFSARTSRTLAIDLLFLLGKLLDLLRSSKRLSSSGTYEVQALAM